jgi:hypothetical protein
MSTTSNDGWEGIVGVKRKRPEEHHGSPGWKDEINVAHCVQLYPKGIVVKKRNMIEKRRKKLHDGGGRVRSVAYITSRTHDDSEGVHTSGHGVMPTRGRRHLPSA